MNNEQSSKTLDSFDISDAGEEAGEEEELDDDTEDYDPIIKRIPIFFNSAPDFSLPSFAHFKPVLEENLEETSAQKDPQSSIKKKRPSALTLLQYPFKIQNPNTSHPLLPPSLRPDPVHNPQQQQPAQIYPKYKPGVRSLKLDLPLEAKVGTVENRFSDERAREFAKGIKPTNQQSINHKTKHSFNDDVCDPLDKMTLGSTFIPEQANYAIGILKRSKNKSEEENEDPDSEGTESDELHLVPLDQTLQMRPNLDYLDNLDTMNQQADKLARQEQGLDSDSSEGGSDKEELDEETIKKKILAKKKLEAADAKAIQVSIVNNAAADGDRMGAGLRSGGPLFAPLRAAEAEAPINLVHYHAETKESEAIRQKLYSSSKAKLVSISPWTELLKV